MPDKWGRPTAQDFAGLQSMYIKGSEYRQKREDEAAAKLDTEKHDEYLDQLSQGATLDQLRTKDSNWNAKAGIAAKATHTAMQRNSAELTKANLDINAKEDLASRERAVKLIDAGTAFLDSGETKQGLQKYVEVFNKELPDGKIAKIIEQDGNFRIQITGADGQVIQGAEAMSEREAKDAMSMLRGKGGKGGREGWLHARQVARRDKQTAELKAMYNPDTARATADGPDILIYNLKDPETGEDAPEYYHTGENRQLTAEEVQQMHLRPDKYWSDKAKAAGALAKTTAEADKARGVSSDKPQSPQGKFAADLMGAYGFDKKESMSLAIELRESEAIGKQVQKLLAEGWEPEEEEVQNLLKSKAAQDIIQRHVDKKNKSKSRGLKKTDKKKKIDQNAMKKEYLALKKKMGKDKARAAMQKKYSDIRF